MIVLSTSHVPASTWRFLDAYHSIDIVEAWQLTWHLFTWSRLLHPEPIRARTARRLAKLMPLEGDRHLVCIDLEEPYWSMPAEKAESCFIDAIELVHDIRPRCRIMLYHPAHIATHSHDPTWTASDAVMNHGAVDMICPRCYDAHADTDQQHTTTQVRYVLAVIARARELTDKPICPMLCPTYTGKANRGEWIADGEADATIDAALSTEPADVAVFKAMRGEQTRPDRQAMRGYLHRVASAIEDRAE